MTVGTLLAKAEAEGATRPTLIELVEAASEAGAVRALGKLGLHDAGAGKDIGDLRQLVQGWRDAKSSAFRAAIGWTVRGLIAMLLVGLAMRTGLL